MNRKDFVAEVKRMDVGQEIRLEVGEPKTYRSLLSAVSLALERHYRTVRLANGVWVIVRDA